MFRYYDNILIPGVTASGTTDGNGVWSDSIDIASVITSADGAIVDNMGAVIIRVVNTNSSQRWAGVRSAGATPEWHSDMGSRSVKDILVTLDGPAPELEFYAEDATTVVFAIVGAFGDGWTWFPRGDRVNVLGSNSNWVDRVFPDMPPEASVFVTTPTSASTAFRWCPTGEPDVSVIASGRVRLLKLDEDATCRINSGVDLEIIGYTTTEVEWYPWMEKSWVPTIDGMYHDVPYPTDGRAGYFYANKTSGNENYVFLPKGDTFPWLPTLNGNAEEYMIAGGNASGEIQYAVKSGASTLDSMYLLASLNGQLPGPKVLSVGDSNTVRYGDSCSISVTEFSDPLSWVTISGVSCEDVVPDGFTLPSLTDLSVVPAPGIRTLIAGNNDEQSSPFNVSVVPPDGLNSVILGDNLNQTSTGTIFQFIPEAKEGDALFTPFVVDDKGNIIDAPAGVYDCWHLSVDNADPNIAVARKFKTTLGVQPTIPEDSTVTLKVRFIGNKYSVDSMDPNGVGE